MRTQNKENYYYIFWIVAMVAFIVPQVFTAIAYMKLADIIEEPIDTFCYDLSEQYKIKYFYSNKIRIKNTLMPGSILMSINDSLVHNGVTYILKEINGEGSYIKLYNPSNDNFCKFHKINQSL